MIMFTVYGEPKGKGRPQFTRTGHAYTPERTKSYEAEIVAAFRREFPDFVRWEKGVPLRVRIKAVYGIPQSDSGLMAARKASGEIRPTKKPDADNVEKVILDALNGIAWRDDAQIVDIRTVKEYGWQPCVTVEIDEIRY